MSRKPYEKGMSIDITVSELAGYEFFIDGEKVQWEEMNRQQQIRVLNSFSQGYNLFINFLKSE